MRAAVMKMRPTEKPTDTERKPTVSAVIVQHRVLRQVQQHPPTLARRFVELATAAALTAAAAAAAAAAALDVIND